MAETQRLKPDVAVLDVRMPRLDGLAVTEAILAIPGNDTRVLVLTTYDADEYVFRILRAGAFLLKSLAPEDLVAAMRVAARGAALIDPSVTRRLVAGFATSPAPPSRRRSWRGSPPANARCSFSSPTRAATRRSHASFTSARRL
ncbi:response regulator transcription factor [Amycolatopsis sp. NPDC023774]|uniref:response regulator n=1 Tax=Amycolatopsis sp. NPDC023774 TaxID=3155015 RepID=UPI0033CD46D4